MERARKQITTGTWCAQESKIYLCTARAEPLVLLVLPAFRRQHAPSEVIENSQPDAKMGKHNTHPESLPASCTTKLIATTPGPECRLVCVPTIFASMRGNESSTTWENTHLCQPKQWSKAPTGCT
ncbi:hypothetical protein JAAARDRAFT_31083 [Jaapia argillacea MUCL 33604]|uniref:Uncharacterized protein n=1 Tax=Jaapia argillacea MUCL 33604 TaxID=933084 RepID=A0A067Q611_9AGAM|nr:hypothetical protein JAAARDRAFT_31083 [Jaapia argillacea MUCL 33604]